MMRRLWRAAHDVDRPTLMRRCAASPYRVSAQRITHRAAAVGVTRCAAIRRHAPHMVTAHQQDDSATEARSSSRAQVLAASLTGASCLSSSASGLQSQSVSLYVVTGGHQ